MPAAKKTRSFASVRTCASTGERQFSVNDLRMLLGVANERDLPDTQVTFAGRLLRPGEYLVRAGEAFEALFVVNSGCLKTVFTDPGGNEQVLGFPARGELIGTDGFDQAHHVNDVVALSDAQLVVVPYEQLRSLSVRHPELLTDLLRVVSHQLVEEQLALTASAALGVEARVARFLLKISTQMAGQGYSASCFNLRMRRQDMGNYLGMQLETVSRTLSQLARHKLITVKQREITILDFSRLRDLARNGSKPDDRRIAHRTSSQGVSRSSCRVVAGKRAMPQATPWSPLIDRASDS